MYVFQMTRKQWRGKQLIQGNFHPANTMAFIDDNHRSRLTLVMAQAHGLASLNFGTCWYNTFCSAVHLCLLPLVCVHTCSMTISKLSFSQLCLSEVCVCVCVCACYHKVPCASTFEVDGCYRNPRYNYYVLERKEWHN